MDEINYEEICELLNKSALLKELAEYADPEAEIPRDPNKPVWIEPRPSQLLPTPIKSSDLTITKVTPQSESEPLAFDTWVHFHMKNIHDPVTNETISLIGKLPMKHPPEYYVLPTEEELKVVVDFAENWILEQKLVRKRQTEKREIIRSLARDLSILRGFVFTDDTFTCEKSCLGVVGAILVFLLDDLVEETDLLGRHENDAHVVEDYLYDNLERLKDIDEDNISEDSFPMPDMSKFPALIPLVDAGKVLAKAMRPYKPKHCKENSEYIIATAKDTFSAVLATQAADKGKISKMSEETFNLLRSADVAALPGVETYLKHRELLLSIKVRDNILFKRLKYVFGLTIALLNDVMGVRKDLVKFESSLILYKMKTVEGMSLKEAYEYVLTMIEFLVDEMNYCIDRLKTSYPDNEVLESYFEILFFSVDVIGYLMCYSNRYGELRAAFLTKQ